MSDSTFGSDASSMVYSWGGGGPSAPSLRAGGSSSPMAKAMRWWDDNGHSVALAALVALVGVVLLRIFATGDPSIDASRSAGDLAARDQMARAAAFAQSEPNGSDYEPDYDALYGNDVGADLISDPGFHRRASPIPDKSRRASRSTAAARCPPAVRPSIPESRLDPTARAVGMARLKTVFRKDGRDFVGVACAMKK